MPSFHRLLLVSSLVLAESVLGLHHSLQALSGRLEPHDNVVAQASAVMSANRGAFDAPMAPMSLVQGPGDIDCVNLSTECATKCGEYNTVCLSHCASDASTAFYDLGIPKAREAVKDHCDNQCEKKAGWVWPRQLSEDYRNCHTVCTKAYEDHYLPPPDTRVLMCPNTPGRYPFDTPTKAPLPTTKAGEKAKEDPSGSCVAATRACLAKCDKKWTRGTESHASCYTVCTHNVAEALFDDIMLKAIKSARDECENAKSCTDEYTQHFYASESECSDAKKENNNFPDDNKSHCGNWCGNFYGDLNDDLINYGNVCTYSCEVTYTKMKRKGEAMPCEALCGKRVKEQSDLEATITGCWTGCLDESTAKTTYAPVWPT